ncbi:MAG: DNA internalization-related competence protein ComEC/Rec2 [Nitrospiraceae bacterium]|nr:MAG: DNA internalization-related competence protein ComEC/Rec2 [Nitrospiraceae bacterium]
MINIALAFISGIAAFNFFPFFPVTIVLIFVAAVILLFLRRRLFGKKAVIVICVALSGFFYSFIRQDALPEMKFPAGNLNIEGTIIGVPEMSGGKLRFTVNEAVVEGQKFQGSIRLVILPDLFREKISGFMPGPGDRVSAVARLKEPGTFYNPGVFSYDLKKDGVAATGYIKQMKIVGRGGGLPAGISGIRQELGRKIDKSLSAENSSLHNAMITGLTGGISREMRDAFSATGLAHLLSISGTHFGLLAFLFFAMTKSAVKCLPASFLTRMTLYITPTRIAIGVTLPVLAVYAVLSGLSTPTIRSFIMVFIYMLALLLGRKGQWLNSLSIAATLILLWDPATLFELSFMLSFVAVLSIGVVLETRKLSEPRTQNPEHRLKIPEPPASLLSREGIKSFASAVLEKMRTGILITLAAVLGTAPFVILYFKQFPLISLLTNLVVTPFICFVVLPLGFVSAFTALIFNIPLMPLNAFIDELTSFALRSIGFFTNFPYANVHLHNPSYAVIAGYYLSLIFLVKNKSRWRVVPLAFVFSIYLVSPHLSENKLGVTFLDAGQGDASVVELPDGKVMLIDGSTLEPDMGRMVIAPYLWAKGTGRIDYMVVSHTHPDHYGGLVYVLEHFDVGEIWFNGMISDDAKVLFQSAALRGVPNRILKRGDVLEGARYRIYVFHPYEDFYAASTSEQYATQNNDSLVLKVETDSASVLFTGDIENEAEADILHLGSRLRSDIIKVPHHGGRSSSSEGFINAVSPEIAVISAGRRNSYGHPHKDTLGRYEKAGATVFRTDINGAVTITGNGKTYEVQSYEDSVFKIAGALRDEFRNIKLLF